MSAGKDMDCLYRRHMEQPGQRDRDPISAREEATSSNVVRTWEALANRPLARTFYYVSIAPIKPKILEL